MTVVTLARAERSTTVEIYQFRMTFPLTITRSSNWSNRAGISNPSTMKVQVPALGFAMVTSSGLFKLAPSSFSTPSGSIANKSMSSVG